MLKTAYQIGVDMAIKEAGLSQDEIEKLAKFLWYRDVAGAFPTFRRLLGMNPEMGHRIAQGAGKAAKKAPVRKLVSRAADPRMAKFDPRAFKR
jgi:hypothetical protein